MYFRNFRVCIVHKVKFYVLVTFEYSRRSIPIVALYITLAMIFSFDIAIYNIILRASINILLSSKLERQTFIGKCRKSIDVSKKKAEKSLRGGRSLSSVECFLVYVFLREAVLPFPSSIHFIFAGFSGDALKGFYGRCRICKPQFYMIVKLYASAANEVKIVSNKNDCFFFIFYARKIAQFCVTFAFRNPKAIFYKP